MGVINPLSHNLRNVGLNPIRQTSMHWQAKTQKQAFKLTQWFRRRPTMALAVERASCMKGWRWSRHGDVLRRALDSSGSDQATGSPLKERTEDRVADVRPTSASFLCLVHKRAGDEWGLYSIPNQPPVLTLFIVPKKRFH